MSDHTNPLSTTQIILIAQFCIQGLILVFLACIAYLVYHTRFGSLSKNDKSATTGMTSDPDLQDVSQLDEAILRTKSHLEESTVLRNSAFEKMNQVVYFLSTAGTAKIETSSHEDPNIDAGSKMTITSPMNSRKRSVSAPSATTAVHEVPRTIAPTTPPITNKIAISSTVKPTDHSSSDPRSHPPTTFANAKANLEGAISILSTDASKTSTFLHSHLLILANAHTQLSMLTTQLKSLRTTLLAKDKALASTTTECTNKNAEIQTLQTTLKALKHEHQTTLHTTAKVKDALEKGTAVARQEALVAKNALAAERAEVTRLRHTLSIKDGEIEGLKKRVLIHEARAVLPHKPTFSTDDASTHSGLTSTAAGPDPAVTQSRYQSCDTRAHDRGRQDRTIVTTSRTTITEPETAEPDEKAAIRKIPFPALTESLTDPADAEREKAELAAQRAQLSEIELAQQNMDEELQRILLREERGGVMRSWGTAGHGSGASNHNDSGDNDQDDQSQDK